MNKFVIVFCVFVTSFTLASETVFAEKWKLGEDYDVLAPTEKNPGEFTLVIRPKGLRQIDQIPPQLVKNTRNEKVELWSFSFDGFDVPKQAVKIKFRGKAQLYKDINLLLTKKHVELAETKGWVWGNLSVAIKDHSLHLIPSFVKVDIKKVKIFGIPIPIDWIQSVNDAVNSWAKKNLPKIIKSHIIKNECVHAISTAPIEKKVVVDNEGVKLLFKIIDSNIDIQKIVDICDKVKFKGPKL